MPEDFPVPEWIRLLAKEFAEPHDWLMTSEMLEDFTKDIEQLLIKACCRLGSKLQYSVGPGTFGVHERIRLERKRLGLPEWEELC